jgi:TP901 family phage tail tape measure protein
MASTTTQWILELVDKITGPMHNVMDAADKTAKEVGNVGKEAEESAGKLKGMSAIDLYAISDSVRMMSDTLGKVTKFGADFEAQLKEVEAITGVTGDSLKELGENARETAKKFGGEATAMLESYKGILSRLGPDMGKDAEALDKMGENIATLSKTMGNDAPAAMDALTTSMLQFGVDLNSPKAAAETMTKMMNVLAAGAKEGAAEVPQISDALRMAGVQAKNSNVSFEETNSALQALAQGGKYGAEAGVALRNVLSKMAGLDVIPQDAQEKIKALGINYGIVSDKTLPLTTRLRELQKAQGDATLIAQMFGTENAAAANILIRSTDLQDSYTKKITDTNVATDQANIIMSGWSEKMSRVTAWFKDLGISFFSVGKYLVPFITGLAGAVLVLSNLINAKAGVMMLFNALKTMPSVGAIVNGGFTMMSTGAKAFGSAIISIPVIGWIIGIITALIALGTYFYNTSATFRGVVWGVVNYVKTLFSVIWNIIKTYVTGCINILSAAFNPKNWIHPGKIIDEIKSTVSKMTDAISSGGELLGNAYQEGKAKGEEDFNKKHPEKAKADSGAVASDADTSKAKNTGLDISGSVSPVLNKETLQTNKSNLSSPAGDKASGSSNGGIKSIVQTNNINNYYTVDKNTNIDAIIEKVVSALNARLQDGIVAQS